jgi:hypothetical protein
VQNKKLSKILFLRYWPVNQACRFEIGLDFEIGQKMSKTGFLTKSGPRCRFRESVPKKKSCGIAKYIKCCFFLTCQMRYHQQKFSKNVKKPF